MEKHDLKNTIVRILLDSKEPRRAVGSGFLVSNNIVVTCAHVIDDALNRPRGTEIPPSLAVFLDLPLRPICSILQAKVVKWFPVKEDAGFAKLEDIAFLEVEVVLPGKSTATLLLDSKQIDITNRDVTIFGFPEGMDSGDWVDGKLKGYIGSGKIQLDHIAGQRQVATGFSGAAVWDKQEKAVHGMVVSISTREGIRSAFMIPATTLFKAWPSLSEQSRLPNPYRGLDIFRENNAEMFFGRDQAITDLYQKVTNNNFVSLIGASGSGKSSILLAGLFPKLRQEKHWLLIHCRPQKQPFGELAFALAPWLYADPIDRLEAQSKLARKLQDGDIKLYDLVHIIAQQAPDQRLLLVVDQFEELYTQNPDKVLQRCFIDALLDAVQNRSTITIVIALRADFMGYILEYGPMAQALNQYPKVMLGAMSEDELRAAIEEPAKQQGVTLEHGLVDRLLRDLGDEPGYLPLLEFALTLLWERQTQRQLTHVAYHEIGGVNRALAKHADDVFSQFNQEDQERLHKIFLKLVQPGEGTEATRQIANVEQLKAENWPLVSRLADERLVVTGWSIKRQAEIEEKIEGKPIEYETAEIAHEALLRHWKRLKKWVREDWEFIVWHEQLRQTVENFESKNRDEGGLLRGVFLNEAKHWLCERSDDFSLDEQNFIRKSVSFQDQQNRARERRRRRLALVSVALAILFFVLAFLAFWERDNALEAEKTAQQARVEAEARSQEAEEQRKIADLERNNALEAEKSAQQARIQAEARSQEADEQRKIAEKREQIALSHKLAAQAELTLNQHVNLLPRSVLLAVESIKRSASLEADQTLRHGLALLPRVVTLLPHKFGSSDVVFSPDGQYLATADSKVVRIWEPTTGRKITEVTHNNMVWDIDFSPDGLYFATASLDSSAKVWEVTTGREIARMSHSAWVDQVVFSPDGQYLATRSRDNTAHLWSIDSGKKLFQIFHHDWVSDITFSPDGQHIATASKDGFARVYKVTTGGEIIRIGHGACVFDVDFSIDGHYLATASEDNTARISDITNGKEITRMIHNDRVIHITYSHQGKYLATGSSDGVARVWDPMSGQEIVRMIHQPLVGTVAFSPDDKYLVTTNGKDNVARIWKVTTGEEVARMIHEGSAGIRHLAYSPDGKYLATATGNGNYSVRIWEVATAQQAVLVSHNGAVNAILQSPGSKYLVTASDDHTARLWETITGREIARFDHEDDVFDIALDASGKFLATASRDHTIRIWDITTHREVARMKHQNRIETFAYSLDGQHLAVSVSQDHTAYLWNVASGMKKKLQHGSPVLSYGRTRVMPNLVSVKAIAFSHNSKFLVTTGMDYTARIWEVATGKEIARMTHNDEPWVKKAVFSPDGRYLVTGSEGDRFKSTIHIWEIASGKEITKISGLKRIGGLVFSPNGQFLAAATGEGVAQVWKTTNGQKVARMSHETEKPYAGVSAVAFSLDGKYLASAGTVDHTARVWEVNTGREIARVTHDDSVRTVMFTQDGRNLVSASNDFTARVWLLWPDDLISEACSRLTRNLSLDEWRQYLGDEPYRQTCSNLH